MEYNEADDPDEADVDGIPVEDLAISQDPSNAAGHFHPLSLKKLGNTLNAEAFAPKNPRRTVRIASGSSTRVGRRRSSPPPPTRGRGRGRGRPPGTGRIQKPDTAKAAHARALGLPPPLPPAQKEPRPRGRPRGSGHLQRASTRARKRMPHEDVTITLLIGRANS